MPNATVIPTLAYPNVREATEWLCRAFGFEERLQIADHRAQLTFGDGAIVVTQSDVAPKTSIMIRVADVDQHFAHAREHGAKILSEPMSQPYGERQYTALDPDGHIWTFSQSIADVDPADWGGVMKK